MKTNSAKQFLDHFHQLVTCQDWSNLELQVLKTVAANHLIDLTSNVRGYLDEDIQTRISQTAAEKLAEKLATSPRTTLTTELWHSIVIDFHRQGQWGIQKRSIPPPPKPKEDTPAREMFRYIWVFVQAGILMKAVVLYFGLHAASDDASSKSSVFLYFALGFSFLSMALFAWRLHRQENQKPKENKNEK